ncbi:response regulator [Pseudonocardia humida]|uniref:Response regulator transcription factor n=1 Tax=Pseudonocardia humida TaxID=2800819 RepID=A0ABT1A7C5_9PSEU|nr:response regulator transcription factor [Pseudonocardia humida]MCO1658836.1 response regulator transcription factor [Pseudonocardia humida]
MTGPARPTRVLLVDDQALVRHGFGLILRSEPDIEVVGEAEDGAKAVEAVRRHRPDVALVDIRMPVLDGLEATRRILADPHNRSKVLILTTFDHDEYVFEALRVGASGFLLKTASPDELVTAVRVVARGDALLSPSITRQVVRRFARLVPRPPAPELDRLTARELDVLRLVSRGMTNGEIAAELVLSEATVKTHVSGMLTKLGLRDRVQAVVFAYENGVTAQG